MKEKMFGETSIIHSMRKKKSVVSKIIGAVKRGKLIRQYECEVCKKPCKAHAHHEDYNEPFQIVWLCASCHQQNHRGKKPKADEIRIKVKEIYNEKYYA